MVNFHIELNHKFTQAYAVFSIQDIPGLEISSPEATIFGLDWNEYLNRKGIETSDIWPFADQPKSLFTAKLFPIIKNEEDWSDFLWIQDLSERLAQIQSWRAKQRFSISDFMKLMNHTEAVRALHNLRAESLFTAIEQRSSSVLPYLPRAHAGKC